MMARVRVLLICLAAVIGSPAVLLATPTSPMHFDHVSLEDGLSQLNVQSILQDSTGYMWFATENGLNRYDGYGIRQYHRERNNPGGLTNDFIWVVAEDGDKNLWLATEGGGLVRWDRSTDSFRNFRHDPLDTTSLASDEIRTLLVNPDGTLWVGTRDKGLDLFDPPSGTARHFQADANDPRSLSNNRVYALHTDSSGHLWVGTDGGANRMNARQDGFTHYRHDPSEPGSLSDDKVRAIYEDRSGTLWIGTSTGGLNRYDQRTLGFSQLRHDPDNPSTLSSDHVRVVFEDDARRLWIGTADGLNLLDPATMTVDRYQHDPSNPQSLNDNYIDSIVQDRAGLLWVGTRSAGVSKWNPRSWSLGHFIQPWLRGTDVTSFASDARGTLWVGTLGAGLARINEKTKAVERYRHRADDPRSLSDDAVMSLLLDRQGILWIGTMSGGLNRLDPATGDIRVFRHDAGDSRSLSADGVMVIHEDRDGRLWVGTYGGGVSVFDKASESFTHYDHDPADPRSLSDPRASAILEDGSGSIWVGTLGGGLNRLDSATGTFRQFRHDPADAASLSDDAIYALHLDGEGTIWVGTAGGGLDRVSFANDDSGDVRFTNISQQDGLPNNVINGIQSDASNRLWLSTNYGLARLDPRSREVKVFHRGHGLQGEEFNFAAHHRAPDGKLYFGGASGFNGLYPDQVREGEHQPAIVLTSYKRLNQRVDTGTPLDRLAGIELDYRGDTVSFAFAALDYAAPRQNSFAYMLEGFDTKWNEVGTERTATYTNLDAGSYRLRAIANTSEGVPAGNEINIPVTVAPAPWATMWAYALYAAGALLLLWMAWHIQQQKYRREAEYSSRLERDVELRTEQLEERNLRLAEASRAKSEFLARMSHEIRTPLNGMLGMTQLLMGTKLEEKQYRFGQTIRRSAESLLEIINDILDFSKIEAGRLELDHVEFNVSDLVDETIELFSGAACEKDLELICSTPPGRTIAALGDPMRLKQVLVNLIGNAIKFTQQGDVVLRYTVLGEDADKLAFRFEVEDTGVGIKADSLSMIFESFSQEDGSTSRRFGGTGLGLAICKQLIEMMGGEIGVASESGKGSRFWFTLSLDKPGPAWSSKIVSGRLAGLNMLVVDDNATSAGVIADYLSAFGISPVLATSGSEALERLRTATSAPFEVVLVDGDVGDMKGLDLAREIKADPVLQTLRVALLNPAAADLDEADWHASGIDDCLPKPVRQSLLYESLIMLTASSGIFAASKVSREPDSSRLEPLAGRVLLVEDNEVNQVVALGMLEELGCETALAVNGREAITRVCSERFDLILMDCEMPVMDGFEATAAIRGQVHGAQDVPIVALTANVVDGDRERCLAAGMQDYLGKPITLEKLHATLAKWLSAVPSGVVTEHVEEIDAASLNSIRNLQGVGGDKMVRQVVDLYLSRSSRLIDSLRDDLLRGDAEAVRQGAHELKSSSLNVGASALARLSQEIEEMGRTGKLVQTERYMGELDLVYPKTVDAIKAVVEPAPKC